MAQTDKNTHNQDVSGNPCQDSYNDYQDVSGNPCQDPYNGYQDASGSFAQDRYNGEADLTYVRPTTVMQREELNKLDQKQEPLEAVPSPPAQPWIKPARTFPLRKGTLAAAVLLVLLVVAGVALARSPRLPELGLPNFDSIAALLRGEQTTLESRDAQGALVDEAPDSAQDTDDSASAGPQAPRGTENNGFTGTDEKSSDSSQMPKDDSEAEVRDTTPDDSYERDYPHNNSDAAQEDFPRSSENAYDNELLDEYEQELDELLRYLSPEAEAEDGAYSSRGWQDSRRGYGRGSEGSDSRGYDSKGSGSEGSGSSDNYSNGYNYNYDDSFSLRELEELYGLLEQLYSDSYGQTYGQSSQGYATA
ncbi:MAG: hypothetical protein IJ125_00360 [Atopobiaceae bacterium]|nr:hypothetical protein [Atopobiaceae bacterium]